MMSKYLLLWMFCSGLLIQHNDAQPFPDLKFTSLGLVNGLPTKEANSVFQDSRGLIWMGTQTAGLLRYDGKKVKNYQRLDNGITGLMPNDANIICEDKNGWLWVNSSEGLFHFDPVTEQAVVFIHNEKDSNSILANDARPYVDSRNRLWVFGYNGLQQWDIATNKFINYTIPAVANPAWQLRAKTVSAVIEDSHHHLWAGSPYGLYLIDTERRIVKPYYTGSYASITFISQTRDGQLWVGFWGSGLAKFNPENGSYKQQYKPSSIINGFTEWEDAYGKNWICFTSETFVLLDPETGAYKNYPADITKQGALKTNNIYAIYKDSEYRLWICTTSGIYFLDARVQLFTNKLLYKDLQSNDPNRYGEPKDLLSTTDGYIVSTWPGTALYKYDKEWHLQTIMERLVPGKPPRTIFSMNKGEAGDNWFCTDSGLVQQKKNTFRFFLPDDTFHIIESKNNASNILKRKDGLYWVRFADRGLYIFDPKKGKFYKNYRSQYQGTTMNFLYDEKETLWLATTNGLHYYNQQLDSFIYYPINHPKKVKTDQYNFIYKIFFDEKNTGWLATGNGLVSFSPDNNHYEFITDSVMQETYYVSRLLQDTTGTIWMISGNKIVAYNKYLRHFQYFSPDDGLPEDFRGVPGIFKWLNDSTIAASSTGILTTFNPYRLAVDKINTKIYFSDLSIDGKRLNPKNGGSILKFDAESQNIFIHFSLLNCTNSERSKLYYRLVAESVSDWIEAKDGDINLLNLSSGEYILEVKGVYINNSKFSSTDQLHFIIRPYWYQTWIFRIIIFLITGTGIYFFIRWRFNAVREAASLKQQITETEMAALKAQMNPHFMFNCINSIDAFIQTNDKYNATLYLNKFAKLIRNVLDSSRQNIVPFSKDIETLKLYIELEELRSETKFTTRINIDEELITNDYQVPPLIIQPFVENAIIHGLRNREGDGGLLTISITKTETHIVYTITDNGIGRLAAERINTGKEKSYGMQMSHDRIKLFNKESIASVIISDLYKNEIPTGTEVIVHLKKW